MSLRSLDIGATLRYSTVEQRHRHSCESGSPLAPNKILTSELSNGLMPQPSYGYDSLTLTHFHYAWQHVAETNVSRHVILVSGEVFGIKIHEVGLENH
jgi:hypothetical protein